MHKKNKKKIIFYILAAIPVLYFMIVLYSPPDGLGGIAYIFIFPPLFLLGIIFLILAFRGPWRIDVSAMPLVPMPAQQRSAVKPLVILSFATLLIVSLFYNGELLKTISLCPLSWSGSAIVLWCIMLFSNIALFMYITVLIAALFVWGIVEYAKLVKSRRK
jgi:hypothetical protein